MPSGCPTADAPWGGSLLALRFERLPMTQLQLRLIALHARLLENRVVAMVVETIQRATAVRVPRMAAAMVFYLLLSMAPMLVVVVGIAGLAVGSRATEFYEGLIAAMNEVVGRRAAEFIAAAVAAQAQRPTEGVLATLGGVFILLWSASRGFNEFQDALNSIWDVAPPDGIGRGIVRTLRQRFLSFVLTLAGGVVVTLYVIVRPAVNTFGRTLGQVLPPAVDAANTLNAALAFVLIAAVLATLYRFLPDSAISWSDVWLGSLLVALVLTVGQVVFAFYLDFARQLGFLGAASSPLVVLALGHGVVQTVYLGAAFSRVYAERNGSLSKAAPPEEVSASGHA